MNVKVTISTVVYCVTSLIVFTLFQMGPLTAL